MGSQDIREKVNKADANNLELIDAKHEGSLLSAFDTYNSQAALSELETLTRNCTIQVGSLEGMVYCNRQAGCQ